MKNRRAGKLRTLVCAIGLAAGVLPSGAAFAMSAATVSQNTSSESGGTVYAASDAKDMAEHISSMDEDARKRLIVSETGDLPEDLDYKTAVYYDGTYIISFDNTDGREDAYRKLGKEFGEDAVFRDAVLSVDTGEEKQEKQDQEQNETEDTSAPEEASDQDETPLVAVIDTGCNDEHASQSINLTSESDADLSGHGTRMHRYLSDAAEGADYKLLSIKACRQDGTALMSNMIAAIRYAEEENAGLIEIPVSAEDCDDLTALKKEIENAVAYGIEVIVPAGDNNGNTMDYVPANIDGVTVVGAAGEDGSPIPSSNTGDNISCYATAEDSSAAAAKYTGYLIAGKPDSEDIFYPGEESNADADEDKIAAYATTAAGASTATGSSSGQIYAVYCSSNTTLYILSDSTKGRAIGSSMYISNGSTATATRGVVTQNEFITCKGTSSNPYCLVPDKATAKSVTKVVSLLGTSQKVQPVSTAFWFYGFTNAKYINVSWIDTAHVTDMQDMFGGCMSVTSLSVESFDTSNVINMSELFTSCSSLESLYLVEWNTSKVQNLTSAFARCTKLDSLNLATWDTSNVVTMNRIFYGCSSLMSVNLGKWDTSSAKSNMVGIFAGCDKLLQLVLGEKTYLSDSCGLGTPTLAHMTCTGNWTKRGSTETLSTDGLITKSQSSAAGLWVADGATVAHAVYCSANSTFYLTRLNGIYSVRSTVSFKDKNNITRTGVVTQNDLESIHGARSTTSVSSSGSTITLLQQEYLVGTMPVADVKAIICTDPVYPLTTEYWFNGCTNVTSIDLSGMDTTDTKTMSNMLSSCKSLKSLTLGANTALKNPCGLYTPSGGSFSGKWKLKDSDSQTSLTSSELIQKSASGAAGTWTAEELVPCAAYCADNNTLYLARVSDSYKVGDTVTITDKEGAERSCEITDVDLGNISFSYSKSMADAYKGKITSVICLSNITPENTSCWFKDYSSVESMDLSLLDTSKVTYMGYMFQKCSSLASLDVSGFDTSKVISMSSMFKGCSNLTSLNVSNFNTGNVTNMNDMFENCSGLTSLDVSGFDASKVTSMGSMFYDCSGLTSLDVSGFDTSKVTNMSNMFSGCHKLTSLDVSGFDTSEVTDIGCMFSNCQSLISLDVSGFDTSKVTSMSSMFYDCSGLTSLDVSGFDTSKVTNMNLMFSDCSSLTSLDVSGFNTSNVANMQYMFDNCSNITSLDVSGFNTSKVTRMDFMFYGCSELTSLDVSNFDTSKVTNMSSMFYGCSKLTSLKLGTKTILLSNCSLKTPSDISKYTGKWTLSDPYNHTGQLSSSELIAKTQKTKVVQAAGTPTATKYAHTSNLDDTGSGSNGYGNNVSNFQTVSIPGASKLYIKVTYQTEDFYGYLYDYLCVYQGTVTTVQSDYGVAGKLGGTTKTTKTIEVDGDTATFYFKSNGSSDDYYGYYAVVTDVPTEDVMGPTGEAAGLWVAEMILQNAKIQVTQYDAGKNKLGGAEYALYKEDGTPVNFTADGSNKIVINQNGQSDVLDSSLFTVGKYYLLETKTPDGYAGSAPVSFEITEANLGTTVQLEVYNNKLVVLPATGGAGRDGVYLSAALLLMAAGIMMVRKETSE